MHNIPHDSLIINIKIIFLALALILVLALILAAGIQFKLPIETNGIHQDRAKLALSMSGGNIKGAEHLQWHSPHDCHTRVEP